MKKLKIALTLLLVLCCSLGLYACKDDSTSGGSKFISEVQLSGQKTNFQEGEAFSTGDLKVTVYYQGDDDAHELTADDYEIDSSAYNKDLAGQYIIYVIPKNQPESLTEGGKDNRVKRSYYASVDHSWTETTDGAYQYECKCGAKRNSYSGLEDKIKTVAWGNPAELTRGGEGKTYPGVQDPIAGEHHVSYGSLVAGQSLTLTLQITALTRNATPGAASAWDSPLMGIRNGADGVLPREDGWIIGQAAGYQVPAECNIPVTGGNGAAGTATAEDAVWQVMTNGDSWAAGTDFPNDASAPTKWSTVVVEYIYQADGVMLMRHTLNRFDGKTSVYTITVNLPKAAYEVCAYGEFCEYTVTAVEFVAGLAIEDYEVTGQPTNLVQPEGKLFDTTGLKTKATFSDKSTLEDNFNAYAYRDITPAKTEAVPDPKPVKTRINLATEPLTADMYEFFVEFNGMQAPLEGIKVIATPVTGANATTIKVNETSFEAPEVAYDYAVTADKQYIRLTMNGIAAKATATQASALGSSTHFIAFKLLTTLKAEEIEVSFGDVSNVVVNATKAGNTVDVVLGLKDGFAKTFDLTLAAEKKVQIDLSGLDALPAAGAEITGTTFTLDAGGTYTVNYTGLTNVENLTLATGNARATVAEVKAAVKGSYAAGTTPDRNTFYRASNTLYIVGIDDSKTNELTVTYWLAAPDLGNLTSERMATAVSIRNGETVLASTNLVYNLEASEKAANIGTNGEDVYVTVSGNKLLVYAFVETDNLKDGLNFSAFLNIEHAYAAGQEYKMNYNVGVTVKNGAAAWLDENVLTLGDSAAKIVAVGTVNDTNDYDKGAILVASLHLPNIGVRESDNEATFHFTGNEDTVNGQNTYMIYTVAGSTITGKETTPSGDRTNIQPGSCVTDDVWAHKEGDFYYGAKITPATGAHTWEAKAGVENMDECSVCHYTREKIGDTYVILETPVAVANLDTDDTWDVNTPSGVTAVSGDFVIVYTWKNTRDINYWDAWIEVNDGKNWYTAPVLEPLAGVGANGWGDLYSNEANGVVTTVTVTKNGEAFTLPAGGDEANGLYGGNYTVTAKRVGTTFTLVVELIHESDKIVVTRTTTGFTTADVTVHIGGNCFWIDNITRQLGEVQTYFGQLTFGDKVYDLAGSLGEKVANADVSGDWATPWDVAASSAQPEGDFAWGFAYDNVRDNFPADIKIQLHDDVADRWGTMDLLAQSSGWPNDPVAAGIQVESVKINGVEQEKTEQTDALNNTYQGSTIPVTPSDETEAAGFWHGHYKLMFVRVGATMKIVVDFERMVGTDSTSSTTLTGKDLPFTASANWHLQVVYVINTFPTGALTINLAGNPYWLDNLQLFNVAATPVTK